MTNSVPPRPRSAVSTGVGMAGLGGFALWTALCIANGWSGPYAALANVVACGVPMVLWSLLVDRVHRNPTTGIDWAAPPRDARATLEVSLTKLAGLWATWAGIALCYCIGRFYWRGDYLFSMTVFMAVAIPLLIASIPYVLWLDRRLAEPRDGAWHLGAWLTGQTGVVPGEIWDHLRAWAVKAFFLAFMVSIVPGGFRLLVEADFAAIQDNPVALALWLITLMFAVDVAFATVGYALTLKPLDAHIRSATPYAAGWAAALICYPPFILMNGGGPLDYQHNEQAWLYWTSDRPALTAVIGLALVALTAIYAWATVAFGLRFSNLTDRGILTHGPYAWTKHPAYLSKCGFWWLSALPFLATSGNPVDAIRNTALLLAVTGVYYWRAKTEEWHLASNPDYAPYVAWMARHGPITRLFSTAQTKGLRAGEARRPEVGEGA